MGLVGHSFGTLTAMRYAIAHPEHVSWLILLATMPPRASDLKIEANIAQRLPPASLARLGAIDKAMVSAAPADQDALSLEMSKLILPAYLYDQSKVDRVLAMMRGGSMHNDTYELMWRSVSKYDITSGLASIHAPVLIVQGREDVLDIDGAEKTRNAIAGAKLVVLESCGHFAWLEAPAELKRAMSAFMSGR